MKIILILLGVLFTFTNSSRYTVDYVDGVNGSVEEVAFDGEGNIYVAVLTYTKSNSKDISDWRHHLYKLTPTREIIWKIDLEPPIELVADMQVTSYGDVYLVYYNWDLHETEELTFAVLKSGSQNVEIIENIATYSDAFFFLDSNDNLIYARENGTLNVLKPNSTVPVPVKNLEGYIRGLIPQYGIEDSKGNVYLNAFSNSDFEERVALITAQSLQAGIPEAQLFEADNIPGQRIQDLVLDKNDDLWVISQIEYQTGFVKKLINGTVQTIKVDKGHPDMWVTAANDRIYVVGGDVLQTIIPTVYYVTLDNEVVEIPELTELEEARFFLPSIVADNDGNAYFKSWDEFTPELGYAFAIKANQDKPVAVDFIPSLESNEYLDALYMDDFGGVWLKTSDNNLRYIEKGDIFAEEVEGNYGSICDEYPVVTNPVTKDIFLSCSGGLKVALDNTKP